jgi:hypothetical protein
VPQSHLQISKQEALMKKGNLLTMALVLIVLLAGVAIKSFGHASSSVSTGQANAIPTRTDAADVRTPGMEIVPAPTIVCRERADQPKQ